MKQFYVCLLLCNSLVSLSQTPLKMREPERDKPLAFLSYPDTIAFNPTEFTSLQSNKQGGSALFHITDNFKIEGELTSAVIKYNGRIESFVVSKGKSADIMLQISRIIMDDGSIQYRGMIRDRNSGDLYVLIKTTGGFSWIKKRFYDVINE